MVNERYEEEGHEEGEYHFSDDQANYDMEGDTSVKGAEAAAVLSKVSVGDKLKQHRRIVIAIVVFIVLLGIVYKLVTPSAQPVTDFQSGANTPAPVSTLPKKIETVPAQPQKTVVTTTTAQSPAMMQPAQPLQPVQPAQPIQPVQPVQSAMPAPSVQQPEMTAPPGTQSPQAATAMAPPPPANVMQNDKNVNDRLATVEQQNSAIMNLMQTQFAQKISDTELQNTQLRSQVQELTARVSNMEVAFRQLTKMLRNGSAGAVAGPRENAPAARVVQPSTKYVVQAIIPGRAWLKSDSGETVTVAEGDSLRGYGRITKIDPYDGVVNIDTGNRVISLAYGLSGD